jgi:hypothetical protein
MIKVLDSGEVIVGGSFNNFDGVAIPHRIVKLSKDGKLNLDFNEKQKSAVYNNGLEVYYVKVEQLDSMVFIKGVESIAVIKINGTVDNGFNMPMVVTGINDMITVKDLIHSKTNKKSANTVDANSCMFTMGKFTEPGKSEPSFLVKLNLEKSSATSVPDFLEERNFSLFKIYPNPVNESVRIYLKNKIEKGKIMIYSASGEKVYESQIINRQDNSSSEIDVRNVAPGIYVIQLSSDSGPVQSQKFIKLK